MKIILRTLPALVLLVPQFASAAFSFTFSYGSGGCSAGLCSIGQTVLYIINGILVPVLFGVAFLILLYGIARAYIFHGGEDAERAKGHKIILWGVIAFVVMISLWGIVNIVATTFGLGGVGAPPPPTSYPGPY